MYAKIMPTLIVSFWNNCIILEHFFVVLTVVKKKKINIVDIDTKVKSYLTYRKNVGTNIAGGILLKQYVKKSN
jgi:hypothetical protein